MNQVATYAAVGAIGVGAIGFLGYVTLANVASDKPYVVTASHAAPNASQADRRIAAAVRATAVEPHRDRSAGPPAQKVALNREKPATKPSVAPSPSASPSALPSASPTPLPTISPKSHAVVRATPEPDARIARAATATARKRAAAANAERAQLARTPVAGSFARTVAASVPAEAPATNAPQPAATVAAATPVAVALAPAATALAAPVYAPEKIVEARVRNAVAPEFPSDPSFEGVRATSVVLVTIGPTGRVLKADIEKSSGYRELDSAATRAARLSTYLPPLVDGRGATESYRMVYEFK